MDDVTEPFVYKTNLISTIVDICSRIRFLVRL